jgi:putative transposase
VTGDARILYQLPSKTLDPRSRVCYLTFMSQLLQRRVTYKLYPNQTQNAKLERLRLLHHDLYNSALAQKKTAIEDGSKVPGFTEQCNELTAIRAQDPLMESLNAQSQQATLKRLHNTFQNFHRRRKAGLGGGFPRFKSRDRFKGFGFKTHGDGWKFIPGNKQSKRETQKHGRLSISGVGKISVRGCPRNQGTPKTLDLTKKADGWHASIVFDCSPTREKGEEVAAFDWGVSTFQVLAFDDGDTLEVPNPRITQKQLETQRELDRKLSGAKLGSNRRAKTKKERARFFQKQQNRRSNFLHQISAALVAQCAVIGTEEIEIEKLTKSEGGKEGLHREIMSTGLGMFLAMLRYKAEEAGARYEELPTKVLAATQRCHKCWKKEKKELHERWHRCECGANCSRDENAARVLLRALLALTAKEQNEIQTKTTGMESGRAEVLAPRQLCETPSIPLSG